MKLSLSRKPEAVAWSIEEILERVRDGQIRLPEFQRLYKWSEEDVVKLFDSIIRGFPIGTFLFWRGGHLESDGRHLASRAPEKERVAVDHLFVLDGQQRLTSLAGVLLASGVPDDPRFRIAFALDRDELVPVGSDEEWPRHAMPLFHALDAVNLMTWANAQGLSEPLQRRALEVGKAIREYRVPAYIVVAEAEETARLIFDRVNSSGKALTKVDVFKALHEGVGAQQPNSLEGLERSVDELGFGPLRESIFLQAAAAVAGLDVTKIDHKALSRPELGAALPHAANALRKAIAFLRHDAHIPHAALLPFGFPLIALTRFHHYFPAVSPRSRELLSRWVWRGAITQKHWSHEQAYLRETLKVIEGKNEDEEVQQMLALLPRQPSFPKVAPYSLKAAQTRLYLLALIDLRPRDLTSGEPLDGGALVARHGSEAVPLLLEGDSGDAAEDAARKTIFGRVIQRPTSQARLHDALGSLHVDDAVLASVGLLREEATAILEGRPFAHQRQARLEKQMEEFFERRARWLQTDRPSLNSLVVEDAP